MYSFCSMQQNSLITKTTTTTTTLIWILLLILSIIPSTSFSFFQPIRSSSIMSSSKSKSATISQSSDVLLISEKAWIQYKHIVQDVMTKQRVLHKMDPLVLPPVQEYLLSNRIYFTTTTCTQTSYNNNHNHNNNNHHHPEPTWTQEQLQHRRIQFQHVQNWTSPMQYEYVTRCLGYVADLSAKTQCRAAAYVAWHKVLECGMLPRESTVSTFLYALTASSRFSSENNDDDNMDHPYDDNDEVQERIEQVATFHDTFYAPNEKTVTLRIKSLITRNDPLAAEQLLMSLPWQKLRTFWPILQYYCTSTSVNVSSLVSALRLLRHMRTAPGVLLDADVYGMLLSTLARHGIFTTTSNNNNNNNNNNGMVLEGIQEYGFTALRGPDLWNQLATEMAEDLLELTPSVVQQIAQGFLDYHSLVDQDATQNVVTLKDHNLLLGRVLVDATTGKCPATGVTLRLMALTPSQRQQVHDTLLEMAGAQHEEYGAKLQARGKAKDETKRNGQYAEEQLRRFSQWLQQDRPQGPFTAIVDGPNVAYFGHGSVHYSQVWEVVQELKQLGERPLVIMPQKYVSRSFWLSGLGKVQELTDQDQVIIDKLQDCMYVVPSTCLDDYYWMLASVAEQTSQTPEQQEQLQLPGLRPLLITNDQMRDHKLTLLEPRLFRR